MNPNTPPNNIEAERQVIGSVLIDPKRFYDIELEADDFYDDINRKLWKKIAEYIRQDKQVDALIISEAAKVEPAHVIEMAGEIITSAQIKYHADIVKDKAFRREIRQKCYDVLNRHEDDDIEELISSMHIATGSRKKKIKHIKDVSLEVFEQIERRADKPDELSGIPTGFHELDQITDGLQGGDFIIVAGRPSMGKSAFAGEIALNSKSHLVTIEMTSGGIIKRWLSKQSNIDLWKFKKSYKMNADEWTELRQAAVALGGFDVTFDETAFTVSEIERSIMEAVSRGAEIAILDYLQLVHVQGKRTREREIGEISTAMKGLAKKLDIPIIAVAQLSRAVEQRENKRPLLSDLRDSGQIEQDADIIIFLYREHYYNKNSDPYQAECIVAKGRETGTGSFKLRFDQMKASFYDGMF